MSAVRTMALLTLPTLSITMTGGAARRELHLGGSRLHLGGSVRLRRSRRAARPGVLLAYAVIAVLFYPLLFAAWAGLAPGRGRGVPHCHLCPSTGLSCSELSQLRAVCEHFFVVYT